MTPRYDGVLLDVDGVLLDSDSDGFQWADEVREEKARELGYRLDLEYLRVLFESDNSEQFDRILDKKGIELKDLVHWERAVAEKKVELVKKGGIKPYSDAEQLLEILEGLNLKVGFLSNAYGEALERIVHELGLEDSVDYLYAPRLSEIEEYVEQMKPNPKMLTEAAAKLQLENPLVVGDSESDVEAANRAGFDSLYLNRNGKNNMNATYSVESLDEARAVLEI